MSCHVLTLSVSCSALPFINHVVAWIGSHVVTYHKQSGISLFEKAAMSLNEHCGGFPEKSDEKIQEKGVPLILCLTAD